MGIHMHLTGSRVADKMKLKAMTRKSIREHQRMHLERAEAMRTEAGRIMAYVAANHEEMAELDVKAAEQMANELKLQAITEENGKCMENAPHG